jgi:hypothetical protein
MRIYVMSMKIVNGRQTVGWPVDAFVREHLDFARTNLDRNHLIGQSAGEQPVPHNMMLPTTGWFRLFFEPSYIVFLILFLL